MSSLTANTLLPLIAALPVDEQAVLRDKLNKMLTQHNVPKRPKKDIYSKIGEKYRPENKEMLVAEIMNGL